MTDENTQQSTGVASDLNAELGFVIKFKNALAVVRQVKNNEWTPKFNSFENEHLTAYRKGDELWIGNGSFFCDVNRSNAFGYLMRHYVWWFGVRSFKRRADLSMLKKSLPRLYDK